MLERVLFAGGGTGGHIFMAVAVAQKLKRRHPAVGFLFVGTPRGLEKKILPGLEFGLRTIEIGGLKNVGLKRTLKTLWQLPASLLDSSRILSEFRPSVVVGLGGYSSGPVVVLASLRKIPCLLIEPNVHPGLTNRLLRGRASLIAVAFEETAAWFGSRARITGIPVREEFFEIRSQPRREGPLSVLVFGGSQGSQALNQLLLRALPHLSGVPLSIVHQTGATHLEAIREQYRKLGVEAEVLEFIEDMPRRFEECDLVIARSGASSIAEIAASGRPAVLIPFPGAADDHQRKNAEALEKRGAAVVLSEATSSGKDLASILHGFYTDRGRLLEMAEAGRRLSRPGSAGRIATLLEEAAADEAPGGQLGG